MCTAQMKTSLKTKSPANTTASVVRVGNSVLRTKDGKAVITGKRKPKDRSIAIERNTPQGALTVPNKATVAKKADVALPPQLNNGGVTTSSTTKQSTASTSPASSTIQPSNLTNTLAYNRGKNSGGKRKLKNRKGGVGHGFGGSGLNIIT